MELYVKITLPTGTEYTTPTVTLNGKSEGIKDWETLMDYASDGKLNYVTIEINNGNSLIISGEMFKNSTIEVCNV